MKERVDTIETELALVKQELYILRTKPPELPLWLKNSAIAIIFALFTQTITAVWWASELTANQKQIKYQVSLNTEFRSTYPAMQQNMVVKLTQIQTENRHIKDMLHEIKDKLRFVDITTQHKKNNL